MILEIRDGSFAYKNAECLFENVNFKLEDRQVLTILGQNGAGKTTLLKCLYGILRWRTGGTYYDGKLAERPRQLRELGYVPQAHPLSFSYTVRELVTMGRAKFIPAMAVPSKQDMERVNATLERVGIADLAGRSCAQLSGGQLQLAFIARALAGEPRVLILDEPESHLDFKNQFMVLNLLEDLVQSSGLSCIINTHFPEHALRISNKTLLLGEREHLFGSTEDVISEQNIETFFGVNAKILDLGSEFGSKKAFVILDRADCTS